MIMFNVLVVNEMLASAPRGVERNIVSKYNVIFSYNKYLVIKGKKLPFPFVLPLMIKKKSRLPSITNSHKGGINHIEP